jgi:hypothetical protein
MAARSLKSSNFKKIIIKIGQMKNQKAYLLREINITEFLQMEIRKKYNNL